MESTEERNYFIEKVKFYNKIGSLIKISYFIFYNEKMDVGIFRKKWVNYKVYIEHDEPDPFTTGIYKEKTDFISKDIAESAIKSFLSKGIRLPTQISKIIV